MSVGPIGHGRAKNLCCQVNQTNVFGIIGGIQPTARTQTERLARARNGSGGMTENFQLWSYQKNNANALSQLEITSSVQTQARLMKQFKWWSFNPQTSGGVGAGAGTMRKWGNRAGYIK